MAIQEHPGGLNRPLARRLWAIALLLYAAVALGDMGQHLAHAARVGEHWFTASNLVVAFSAGLFWPADLIAGYLLSR